MNNELFELTSMDFIPKKQAYAVIENWFRRNGYKSWERDSLLKSLSKINIVNINAKVKKSKL